MAKKRILSVLFALLVAVPLIALPVFATGSGSGQARYSVIPWETIGVGTDYKNFTEFAGHSLRTNSQGSVVSPMMTQYFSMGANTVTRGNVEVYTSAGNRGFQLAARNFVLDMNTFDILSIYSGMDGEWETSVIVTGHVLSWKLVGDDWQVVSLPFSLMVSGDYPDVATAIKSKVSALVADRYVYFGSLVLTATTSADQFDGYFNIDFTVTNSIYGVANWANQYNINHETVVNVEASDPSDVSFVDWLVVGVGGFLQFELWPGFTLNQLIEFVVVIGLVLWFITLLI